MDRMTLELIKKRYYMSKDKEAKMRWYERCSLIKSNPILTRGQPTNWRTIIPKKFSHCCEDSEPHIRLSSLRIQERDWDSPRNLTLKASRI